MSAEARSGTVRDVDPAWSDEELQDLNLAVHREIIYWEDLRTRDPASAEAEARSSRFLALQRKLWTVQGRDAGD